MTIREDILKELENISLSVAAVPRVNVFTVAPDYFDGIQAELNARISADSFYSQNAFSVPEGYFEGLEQSIFQKIKASEEEFVSGVLQSIGNRNIFTVPQGYFEGVQNDILQKISSEETAASEIEQLSPVIAGIGRKNIFTVPANYFEQLRFAGGINAPAKVVQMTASRSRSVFRYAAAAVITALLGIAIINVGDRQPAKTSYASVNMDYQKNIQSGAAILKSGTFDKELASLSDDDIDQYFKAEGQDVNAALVAASVDNKNAALPEATDYLVDENTLDNYLQNNNLKN